MFCTGGNVMADNRPTGRRRNVLDGGMDVHKRGEGLGTGPVGSGGRPGGSSGGGGNPLKSGGGKIGLVAIVLLLLFGGGSSLFSSETPDETYNGPAAEQVNNQSGQGPSHSLAESSESEPFAPAGQGSESADTSVAEGARDRFTAIKGDGSDTVTIMVYMCGTDLESKHGMATNDLNEMAKAALSDKVNIIVYTGGCTRWNNSVISSRTNQIYRVKNGGLECLEADMGPESMVKPSTLTGFIKYCSKNYPADRNEIIFWDHGGGSLSGYGYDEKNAGSGSMTLAGINTAFRDAGVKFDFIGFDACLMATVENALMLEQYGDYLIASEETEPGVGWYYTNWLTALSKDTSMPTVEIGKRIVDDFIDVCNQKCPGQKTTLSVVDLAELKATVPAELTGFARSTNDLIKNKEYRQVSDARYNTREFAQSSRIDQVDLVHLCMNMGTKEGSDLARVLQGAVKYNRTAACINNANGLSIYFPYKKAGNVKNALATYQQIGMDEEYSNCIKEFAGLEISGQISAGGISSPMPSLFGTLLGGGVSEQPSGGSYDLISGMLGGLLSGQTSAGSYGFDPSVLDLLGGRSLSTEDTAQYISGNYFDADSLVWTLNDDGDHVIHLSDDQWKLIENVELNIFIDDGEGYIDLGLDNVFTIDDDGDLIGEDSNTAMSIGGQPVAFYVLDTVGSNEDMVTTGYVPALLNGERVELIIVFDGNADPYIAGARTVYKNNETETIAKNLTGVRAGDKVEFLCDYYSYDGEYLDSYKLGEQITLTDDVEIGYRDYGNNKDRIMYRLTDIYQQHYWTPVLPD